MEKLTEIWPFVETFGIPILAFFGLLTFVSLNFYWRTISDLRRLENYIDKKGTVKGFLRKSFPIVSPLDIVFGFMPLSRFSENLTKFSIGREYLDTVRIFRKYYRVLFPTIIGIAAIGIAINERNIDK